MASIQSDNLYFLHESSIVDSDVTIGEGTKIWHFSHILDNTRIGENCNIGQNVVIGPDVLVGNGCKIQNNVSVYKGVTLEDEVFCGPSMVFTNVFNPRSHVKRMDEIRPTLVKKGASLGANCTIVCGITIGHYAFVGAGAVVTKDIPDHAMVAGNPARQIGWMCECGEKLSKKMECPVCKKTYPFLNKPEKEVPQSIPFIDLAAQKNRILPRIQKRIQTVLEHGKYIMGPEIKELEDALADYIAVKHAITCSSGTDALLMALMAKNIGPGDAVFTTPYTFFATAEVIALLGATPIFVDIDYKTFNMSPAKLESAIKAVQTKNHSIYPFTQTDELTPKAVMSVDMFGLPCDYDQLEKITSTYGLFLIEDAAQGFGGVFNQKKACTFGDIGCTSFFPAKPLGCYGDGGAVFTDSDEIAGRLESIRVHGKGLDKYNNDRVGLNARMDTIQAAILLEKLKIFPDELTKRQAVAKRYSQKLADFNENIVLPDVPVNCLSAWAQYSILLKTENLRNTLQKKLKESGIPSMIYYPVPVHRSRAFRKLGYPSGSMPVSEDCSKRILSLPMHPYMEKKQQDHIISAVQKAMA